MINPYRPSKGINIYDRADFNVQALAPARIDDLMSSDEEALLLEPVTLDDIEQAYLGEHLTVEAGTAMFEAVSTTRMRLAQTMRAFVRVLNRGLNGTGIIAGTHDAGADETGQAVVGGASIGNVRKVAGIPVMTAKIPLTDGQSVSLIFHSPTATGSKLVSSDALVAFKFLLNARDVTHVVAPVGGRDISLDQTAQSLSNLIERNSAKFKKQQQAHKTLRANAESAEDEANKLEVQAANEMTSADAVLIQKAKLSTQYESVNSALARIQQENSQLMQTIEEIKRLKAEKQAKQGQDGTEPPVIIADPAADNAKPKDGGEATTGSNDKGLFYYGMKARPAWKPSGAIEEFAPEQAADLEIVKRKEVHANDYRWGVVAYAEPLSETKIEDYELVDFQAKNSSSEAQVVWDQLNPLIAEFKRDNPDATEKKFLSQYLKFNAPDGDKLPQAVKDAGGAIPLLRVIGQAKKQTTLQAMHELYELVSAAAQPAETQTAAIPPVPPTEETQETAPVVDEPPLNEADEAALAGINYLASLLSFESSDPTLIDVEMAKVQDIAASLMAAGKMEENEDLLNRVADHLVGLSVKIAQGGAL